MTRPDVQPHVTWQQALRPTRTWIK